VKVLPPQYQPIPGLQHGYRSDCDKRRVRIGQDQSIGVIARQYGSLTPPSAVMTNKDNCGQESHETVKRRSCDADAR